MATFCPLNQAIENLRREPSSDQRPKILTLIATASATDTYDHPLLIMRGNHTPGRPGCDSFKLTHMPRDNHAQSIATNGGKREDKTLLQRSQLRQHGKFWHVSISERQRPRPCGKNLCGPFMRAVLNESRQERSSNGGRQHDKHSSTR